MNKIFIYGVPGSGKTHTSRLLAEKKGISSLEVDRPRSFAQSVTTEQENSFLFTGTCQAYKNFGELNEANCVQGLVAVRHALQAFVVKGIKETDQLIVEAAFLDPNILSSLGKMILLIVSNESEHRKRFFTNRAETSHTRDEFLSARLIQSYLIDEAEKLGIDIIKSDSDVHMHISAYL